MACFKKRGPINWEADFPHRNWPIIFALQAIISVAYIIMTPSLYQFITTPRSLPEDEQGSSKFWPGLGGSETHYALAIMFFGIGEFIFTPITGILSEKLPFTLSLISTNLLLIIGGVMYAVAVNISMVLAGRFFIGIGAAFAVTVHAYIGEMGTRLDEVRRKKGKKPVKHFLYIAYSFVANGGFVLTFGVVSIMALFSNHVNPYRWPGLFLAAISLLYIVVIILVFRETRTFNLSDCRTLMKCQKISNLSRLLDCKFSFRWISYMFLFSSGFLVGLLYSVLATLVTPVLSDQFGFSVDFTAHYLNGMGLALFGTSFIQLGVKALKVNNRIVLGLAFTMALVGVLLMGDWQTIGHDPCSSTFNTSVNVTTGVSSGDDMITSGMGIDMVLPSDPEGLSNSTTSQVLGDELGMNFASPSPSSPSSSSSNSSDYQLLVESCEAQSSSSHQCFWNPESRITGEFCNTCHKECLSKKTSINFYQFTAGVMLVSLATPLGFVFISAITSDFTPLHSQGTALSVALGTGSFCRGVSPYWLVESYEGVGKHTYPSAAITAAYLLAMLIMLCALYRSLAPRRSTELGSYDDSEESSNLEGKFRSLDSKLECNGFSTDDTEKELRTQQIEGRNALFEVKTCGNSNILYTLN